MRQTELAATGDRNRRTEHTAGVLKHEIDLIGRDLFSGDDDVALVLAILVINDDHHFTITEIRYRFFYLIKFYFLFHIIYVYLSIFIVA